MRNLRVSAPAALLLAFLSTVVVAQTAISSPAARQANRVTAGVDAGQRVMVAGHLPAWKSRASDLGSLPDNETVELNFAVSRAPEVQAAFEQLLADQQNPSSARFHQWLTPVQVGEQYGPTQHDLDALTQWLTGQGFKVDGITPSRLVVQVSASSAVVSAALGTSIHTYTIPGHAASERLHAPVSEPVVPAALAPVISFIDGLIEVPIYPHSVRIPNTPMAAAGLRSVNASGVSAPAPDYTLSGGTHFLSPADFNLIYGVAPAYTSGITGTGQKIMIIGGSRLLASDISSWESLAALTAYQPNYIIGPSFTDPGYTADDNTGEGTLDFERAYGTAQGATVDMVIAKNWLNGTTNANLELYAIGTVNDPIMSLSYSSCEYYQGSSYVNYESNNIFGVAASQGISVFASSGDAGVTGCAQHDVAADTTTQFKTISDICASPYVTCVGGTQFSDTASPSTYWAAGNTLGKLSALSYIPEGVWNEPTRTTNGVTSYIVASGGGGPSVFIAKPTWQTGTGVPADGVRDTPDISFSASGHNAYFSCLAYAGADCTTYLTGFGGTSASAPSMAGVAALINQKLGARQGNMNPLLYKTFNSTPSAFYDATPASSGVTTCSTATPTTCNNSTPAPAALTGGIAGYPLTAGFDLATGLGSMNVNAFLTAIAVTQLTPTTSTVVASPTSVVKGGSIGFTDTVKPNTGTGVPTGNVVFTIPGTATGTVTVTYLLSGGIATAPSMTFTTPGTYTVTATYSGDANYASSVSTAIFTVVGPTSTTVLTGTSGTVTTQTPVTYTAAVSSTTSGTLGGTVQFVRTANGTAVNLGSAITVISGKATLPATTLPIGSYTITAVYSGDTTYAGSSSNAISITVTGVGTTTTVNLGSGTATSTTPVSVSAAVTTTGTGTPTGTITFTSDGVTVLTASLLNANASGSVTLPTGTHSICAIYNGDATFAGSNSTCKNVVVSATPTALALAPASATLFSYQTTTLTATLTGLSATVAGSGTVTFRDGTTVLGSSSIAVVGSTATATFAAGPLSVGAHTLTATYNGDGNYSTSTSNTSSITVLQSSIVLSTTLSSVTTAAGTPVTNTLNVAVTNLGTVTQPAIENLTCTVIYNGTGAVGSIPTCTASPSSLSITGTGVSSTLTISSIRRSAVTTKTLALNGGRTLGFMGLGVSALCGLLAFGLPRRSRKLLRSARVLASLAFLLAVLGTASGCGSNNFSGNPVAGATAGNYTVTVTASGTANVSGATTFGLIIQ